MWPRPVSCLITTEQIEAAKLLDSPMVDKGAMVDPSTLLALADNCETLGHQYTKLQHNRITTALYAAARQLREQEEYISEFH